MYKMASTGEGKKSFKTHASTYQRARALLGWLAIRPTGTSVITEHHLSKHQGRGSTQTIRDKILSQCSHKAADHPFSNELVDTRRHLEAMARLFQPLRVNDHDEQEGHRIFQNRTRELEYIILDIHYDENYLTTKRLPGGQS